MLGNTSHGLIRTKKNPYESSTIVLVMSALPNYHVSSPQSYGWPRCVAAAPRGGELD